MKLLLLSLALSAATLNTHAMNSSLNSDELKTLYAMGSMLGQNLARLNLNDKELAALTDGLHEAAKNEKSRVDLKIYQSKVQGLFKERLDRMNGIKKK